MSKVWFVTGAARGFGKLWVTAALKRGDKVAATARDIASLDSLVGEFGGAILPIELDVTDRAAVFAAVARAKDAFGRLDVVISNAGYGHQGAIEEASEDEARAQMETNLFGALWVAQAALPILRAQQSGHIIAVSSTLGLVAIPNFGIYQASKFAVEGLFDTLSQEVSRFGVNVTLIEPSAYATDFTQPVFRAALHCDRHLRCPARRTGRTPQISGFRRSHGDHWGDPETDRQCEPSASTVVGRRGASTCFAGLREESRAMASLA